MPAKRSTDDAWCILRCSGQKTLRLATTLAEDGFAAWTPVENVQLRARRSYPKEVVRNAIMPGYVFAKEAHLLALLALTRSPSMVYRVWDPEKGRMISKGHPYFRLFMPFGKPELVTEKQIANLRRLESLTAPKVVVKEWARGDRVRLVDGAYAGLSGTVVKRSGDRVTVEIEGWSNWQPEVAAWLLHPPLDGCHASSVCADHESQALSAKAA